MTKLSVTVITKNEAAHIAACLASVSWADERLVVDSGSTDGTPDLARAAGARVIVRDWPGYSVQKNFAASQASYDWILSVDADERVTPELSEEIQLLLRTPPSRAGYRVPRVTWHLGRWIRTTDWYPDFQLRLYDRRRAEWPIRRVHESVAIKGGAGSAGQLSGELQHYAYRDISHHHRTMDLYTSLAAEEMYAEGRRASVVDLLIHPPAAFLRNFLLRRGVGDGAPGLIISAMNAHYVFLKFAKLWALGQASARKGDPATRP